MNTGSSSDRRHHIDRSRGRASSPAWSGSHSAVPESPTRRHEVRTFFGTLPRPACCGQAPRLTQSGPYSGIGRSTPRPITQKWTSSCCSRSHSPGRERRHAEQVPGQVHRSSSLARLQVSHPAIAAQELRQLCRGAWGRVRTGCSRARLGWAPSPPQRRNRLSTVRRFAMALHAEDRCHELPPADAFGRGWFERRVPHVYRPDEIAALIKAAAELKPSGSIRPLMYATLFGLLAATGMRISEALALRLEDLTEDGLVIRETKFKKSRLLPLHETTRHALDRYLSVRNRLGTLHGAFFIPNTAAAPAYPTVVATFLRSRGRLDCERRPAREVPASTTCDTAS